jgi:hypothetical protein
VACRGEFVTGPRGTWNRADPFTIQGRPYINEKGDFVVLESAGEEDPAATKELSADDGKVHRRERLEAERIAAGLPAEVSTLASGPDPTKDIWGKLKKQPRRKRKFTN